MRFDLAGVGRIGGRFWSHPCFWCGSDRIDSRMIQSSSSSIARERVSPHTSDRAQPFKVTSPNTERAPPWSDDDIASLGMSTAQHSNQKRTLVTLGNDLGSIE